MGLLNYLKPQEWHFYFAFSVILVHIIYAWL